VITDDVRRGIENGGGPEGRAWIGARPAIVDRVCAAWSLTTGPVLEGGKAALVMRVRRSGKDAVLKIAPPGVEFASEIATIAAAGGRGYVRLLAHDLSVNAALLEPLGDTLQASPSSVADKLDVLAATLIQAWRTPKPPATGRHKAADLIEDIAADWERLGHPCSGALKDTAIEYARRRLDATGAQTVLCHGDPHPAGVTVRSFTGEVLASDDPVTLLRAWCARLAGSTGADAQAIWEWALIERVSSGLFLMICGHNDEGRAHLDSAEHLIR